jgi:hypothetical protein
MSIQPTNKDFLRWEVKPIWRIYFPSSLVGGDQSSFTIYGVDRGSLDISRNWEKIHSVEQFNQGYVVKPSDFTFTIAVKENGDAFEKLRRLGKGGQMFDVECDLLRINDQIYGDRPEEHDGESGTDWMRGFEKYLGCVINREGQTVDLATFPVREFEIMFLQHAIKQIGSGDFEAEELREGDGRYPQLDELGI